MLEMVQFINKEIIKNTNIRAISQPGYSDGKQTLSIDR